MVVRRVVETRRIPDVATEAGPEELKQEHYHLDSKSDHCCGNNKSTGKCDHGGKPSKWPLTTSLRNSLALVFVTLILTQSFCPHTTFRIRSLVGYNCCAVKES